MDAFSLPSDGNTDADDPIGRGSHPGKSSSRAYPNSAAVSASTSAGHQRRWDQGHGWGEGWLEDSQEEQRATPPTAAAAPLVPPQSSSSSSNSSNSSSSDASPSSYAASPSAAGGAGTAGLGRGRGGGRGHGRDQHGCSGSRSLGAGFGGGDGGGSNLGGLGEPLSRLGKRQGYAGRGQGDEPWNVAAPAGGTLMQPQAGGGAGTAERGWGRGAASGCDDEDQKEEDDEGWGAAGSRGRGRAKGGEGEGRGGGSQTAVLFTGSDDGTAKAWDAESGRFVCVYAGHTRGVTCLQAAFTEVGAHPRRASGGPDECRCAYFYTSCMFMQLRRHSFAL